MEGALKLKEVSYIHAEGYPAGEMKHGPIALIDREMPVIALAPQDHLRDKMMSNIEQVKAREGTVIVVATEGDEEIAEKADHVIYVPRDLAAAVAGAHVDPAADVRLPRRGPARVRRRPAAQPGEDGHGRIAETLRWLAVDVLCQIDATSTRRARGPIESTRMDFAPASLRKVQQRLEERERALSPHAARSFESTGRETPEEPSLVRTEYQRDRDRIIHCKAFRRLKHKTQVFIAPVGDHYVTRLTHTLEVAQIARTIARALNLNEDLAEASALAHDIGHPPFGHAGEQALADVVPEGFRHAEQSLRVVDKLERLNLTWEVRDGIVNCSKVREDILAEGVGHAGDARGPDRQDLGRHRLHQPRHRRRASAPG